MSRYMTIGLLRSFPRRIVPCAAICLLLSPALASSAAAAAGTRGAVGPGAARHAPFDEYGAAVAISGRTIAVGAFGVRNEAGTVSIFSRSNRKWRHQETLRDPRAHAHDCFGWSVGLTTTRTGTYAVIGADCQNGDTGAIYIYKRSGTLWKKQARFTDPGRTAQDFFGYSVAISGSTVLAGAASFTHETYVYAFSRSGSRWHQQAVISDPASHKATDQFGQEVALTGNTAVIGSPGADGGNGVAYIYQHGSGAAWSRISRLVDSGVPAFGQAVGISKMTAVVGGAGGAAIFSDTANGWRRQARLFEPRKVSGLNFGTAVAISGDRVLVSDQFQVHFDVSCGGAYEFLRSGGKWARPARVVNPGCSNGDAFASAMALEGRTAVIGAPGKNDNAGQAYVLTLP